MRKTNPFLLTDFYKTIHHMAYAPNTTKLVSYWTPRMSRKEGMDEVVMFGLQAFVKKYLIDYFDNNFFDAPRKTLIREYERVIRHTMGVDYIDSTHILDLHDLGYLPIEIKAVPEGTLVPIKVPMIEISSTHPQFAWVVNYLETFMSCHIWQPMTSATIAHAYRNVINKYFDMTCEDDVNRWKACGDFSMRGFSSLESAEASSAGHLLSFTNTATIPSILYLEEYYNANIKFGEVATGTPSTEHSVMCSYGKDGEWESYKHLINDVFPRGNISLVSDTYDYWSIITDLLPTLKEDIMARDGKVIIRGDSGDPVKIICGDSNLNKNDPAYKGTVELLWDIFGGTINSKGYKVLDKHIGTIYGDSITLERCEEMCKQLESKGFAVSNCIFGSGSYTYQYVTRDTFGFALKATHSIVDGEEQFIFKEPKTDTGNFKKSQRGMCVVVNTNPFPNNKDASVITYKDGLTIDEASSYDKVNLLQPVFRNGYLIREQTLSEIRDILNK